MNSQLFLMESLKKGFSLLKAARLRFAPKDTDESDTIKAWTLLLINECNWNARDDLKRINEAFICIGNHDHDFPTVKRFKDVLAPRKLIRIAHKEEEISEEQRFKNLQLWADAIKEAVKPIPVTSFKTEKELQHERNKLKQLLD